MSKKGFTLIELLSVIVILAIILAIAILRITSLIENAKRSSFEIEAQMILMKIEQEKVLNRSLDITTINKDNIQSILGIANNNFDSITVTIGVDGKYHIEIVGANKWAELTAQGTYENMIVSPTFFCGDILVDSRDGNEYATVQIGEQCWFAGNLRYTTTECLNATWNSSEPFNACRLNGGTGWDQNEVVYQWGAAMDGNNGLGEDPVQGLCPDGWYIPTHDDWTTLERNVCNEAGNSNCETNFPYNTTTTGFIGTNEGTRLKSTNPSWNGTNTVGFDAKPAGYRSASGLLLNVGSFGVWWSSSPSGSAAWRRYLSSGYSSIGRFAISQADGYSVRCRL